jgi:hypothetical protein
VARRNANGNLIRDISPFERSLSEADSDVRACADRRVRAAARSALDSKVVREASLMIIFFPHGVIVALLTAASTRLWISGFSGYFGVESESFRRTYS